MVHTVYEITIKNFCSPTITNAAKQIVMKADYYSH